MGVGIAWPILRLQLMLLFICHAVDVQHKGHIQAGDLPNSPPPRPHMPGAWEGGIRWGGADGCGRGWQRGGTKFRMMHKYVEAFLGRMTFC